MKPLDVYPRYDIEPVRAKGALIWDANDTEYLDGYGGHAVISIGHAHPHYIGRISAQLHKMAYYSNSVKLSLQETYADKLGKLSDYPDYNVFFCNSGAEANENAIKVAAFANKKSKIITFRKAFHGRTSMAVSCTDAPNARTRFDNQRDIIRLPLNDEKTLENAFNDEVCAVLIEGITGIGGIHVPEPSFLKKIRRLCDQFGAAMILDEVQSGFGRTGKFFAHRHADITADIITIAKGMGNGFPMGGVLVAPKFDTWKGMLGSTFGGNPLACAAGLAVLEVMESEQLIEQAHAMGAYFREKLRLPKGIKEIRGLGLMLGLVFDRPVAEIRKKLLCEHHVFTGSSSDPHVLRLLPPLCITKSEIDRLIDKLKTTICPTPPLMAKQ